MLKWLKELLKQWVAKEEINELVNRKYLLVEYRKSMAKFPIVEAAFISMEEETKGFNEGKLNYIRQTWNLIALESKLLQIQLKRDITVCSNFNKKSVS